MSLDSIAIFPGDAVSTHVTSSGRRVIPVRESYEIDRFAAELGKHTSARVRVDARPELPPPAEGEIFVCLLDVMQRSEARDGDLFRRQAPRVLLLDAVRSYALEWAERLALSGVVDSSQYFQWMQGHKSQRTALYGLKRVGQAMGVTKLTPPETEHYGVISRPDLRELPALVAAYLEAYT